MPSQVNSLTERDCAAQPEIQSTSPNADAGTLEDQRQQDLSQLSQLIGINQVTTENNGLSITTTSGQLLVSEGQSFQLTTGTVNGVTDFFLGGNDITAGADFGRRATGRLSDGARPGHSQRARLARSTCVQHLDGVNAQNNAGPI